MEDVKLMVLRREEMVYEESEKHIKKEVADLGSINNL